MVKSRNTAALFKDDAIIDKMDGLSVEKVEPIICGSHFD